MAKPLTVYDFCKYVLCKNGKATGHRLFRFPEAKDPERQRRWIENAGNNMLLNWTPSSVRSAGLCNLHFRQEDFVDANKMSLKRNRDPLNWREVQNQQQQQEQNQQQHQMDQQQHQVGGQNFQQDQQEGDQQKTCQEHQDMHQEHSRHQEEHIDESELASSADINMTDMISQEEVCTSFDPSLVKVTYPPAQKSFCTFQEKDSDLNYLNYDIDKTPISTASSKNKFASLSKKKPSHCCLLYARTLQKSLVSRVTSLSKKVQQLKKALKAEKMRSNRKHKRLIKTKKQSKFSIEEFLLNKDIQPLAKSMIKLQLHKRKSPYANDEKQLAKLMYYHSAACYIRLRKAGLNLPAESTVRGWVAKYDVVPGINDIIFKGIEENLKKLPADERVCALKFDEMSIKAYEEYSKKYDLVEGLTDLGIDMRSRETAKHALLFCLDSINAKNPWRQMLAFGFNENGATADELFDYLQVLLMKLREIGADVRLIVCDQGSSNQKLFKRLDVSIDSPYFYVNDVKYLATFDWPHLIKRLIAQLRSHEYIFADNQIIMNFNDLKKTWELDKSHGTSNLLGHLKESHFSPNSFDAMRVKNAFQLLSRRMASSIKMAGADCTGLMSSTTWQASADFVEKLDAVIDACNSLYLNSGHQLKQPLSEKHPEIQQRLEAFLAWSKKWTIKTKTNNFSKPPCFFGIPLTVQALLILYQDLKSEFCNFELATGLCNQDSVEHAHSKLRGRGGFNANPTCRMYRLTFRHILSTDFLYTSMKGNVTCSDAPSLIDLNNEDSITSEGNEFLSTENCTLQEYELKDLEELEKINAAAEFSNMYLKVDSLEMTDMSDRNVYESNAIAYFAGYIAKQCLMKRPCDNCEHFFIKPSTAVLNSNEQYIAFRDYSNFDSDTFEELSDGMYLTRATEIFTHVVNCQLEAFQTYHESVWHQKLLVYHLTEIIEAYTREKYPDWFDQDDMCYEHRISALKYLLRVKIHAKTRQHNNDLKQASKRSIATKNQKLKNIKNI